MPVLIEKDFLTFRAGQWLGATVWVPHRNFLKERNRGVAEQGAHAYTGALPAKRPDLKSGS